MTPALSRIRSVGLIGAGKMAQAIANGIVATNRGATAREGALLQLRASCPDGELLRSLPGECKSSTNNLDTVEHSDLIIIAVKPDVVRPVLREVSPKIDSKRHIVLSVAGGVTVSTFEEALPSGTRIVRVMPNVACEVRQGATVFFTRDPSPELDEITRAVFAPISPVCQRLYNEALIDAATGLSGSGPAYILYIIEALADAGVRQGIPRDVALELATQTVKGAAVLSRETGRSPSELKNTVTSPGGCTAEGLFMLEKYAVKSAIHEAVCSAKVKIEQLQ